MVNMLFIVVLSGIRICEWSFLCLHAGYSNIAGTPGGNFCHKHPLKLKDELIRMRWSKVTLTITQEDIPVVRLALRDSEWVQQCFFLFWLCNGRASSSEL